MAIFITGDCHGDWTRFKHDIMDSFYAPDEIPSRADTIIVCGDFGIWQDTKEERYWLDWIEKNVKQTVCFVDGNHENFDRLYSGEFPRVPFYGSIADKIRDNVYHLKRGCCYTIEDKTFFTFGGAQSHDLWNGVVEPDDKKRMKELDRTRSFYRVNHESWWKEELPSESEMTGGQVVLSYYRHNVDYIISHCAPTSIQSLIDIKFTSDILTDYLQEISENINFKHWYFGHYHKNMVYLNKYSCLYKDIERII